jgi:hypothetical protein
MEILVLPEMLELLVMAVLLVSLVMVERKVLSPLTIDLARQAHLVPLVQLVVSRDKDLQAHQALQVLHITNPTILQRPWREHSMESTRMANNFARMKAL